MQWIHSPESLRFEDVPSRLGVIPANQPENPPSPSLTETLDASNLPGNQSEDQRENPSPPTEWVNQRDSPLTPHIINGEGLSYLLEIPPENQPDIPPSRSLTSSLGLPGSLPENTPSFAEASYFSGLLAATRTSHSIGSLDYLPSPQETESLASEQASKVLQSSDVQDSSFLPDSIDHSSRFPLAQDFPAQHLQTTGPQQMAVQPESSHQLDAYGWQQVTDGGIVPNTHQQVTWGATSQLPVNTDQLPPQAPVSKDPTQTAPYKLRRRCGLCNARLADIAGLRTHWANVH